MLFFTKIGSSLYIYLFSALWMLKIDAGHLLRKISSSSTMWEVGEKKSVDNILEIYCWQHEPKTLAKIWKRATLKLHFNGSTDYELFEEATQQQVQHMFEEHRKSWFYFWPVQTTDISLSLFNSTCIGVATSKPYQGSVEVKTIYSPYLVASLSSILLFYMANRLSKNIAFYYGTGISIGMVASILILFFILSRLIPGKKAGMLVMFTGVSTFLTTLQYIWRSHLLIFLEEHYDIVLAYLVFSGLLSFALLYWYGPPSNPRSLDIVQWMIQLVALSLLYYSIQVREVAVATMISLICVYNFPTSVFMRLGTYWRLRFPPKPRLLSIEEYEKQADEYTKKSLEELRGFCRSPQCDAWKTISKLDSPTRFAEFVEGSFHLQDDELLRFDAGDSGQSAFITSDDDSDAELDFRLSAN